MSELAAQIERYLAELVRRGNSLTLPNWWLPMSELATQIDRYLAELVRRGNSAHAAEWVAADV